MSDVFIPVFGSTDELLLHLLQDFFEGQDIHIGTLFSEEIDPPMIIARADRRSGSIAQDVSDDRFLQPVIVSVSTITSGVDADEIGEELQEAVRVCLRQAQLKQTVVPNGGYISRITNATPPSRVSDYATSTGVVQYASLPSGWVRFESVWRLILRHPPQSTITNRFLTIPGQ
jgi:hypothetical protein